MPTYCFEDETGVIHDRFFRMADVPKTIKLEDGRIAHRSLISETKGVPAKKGWPIVSVASGVRPEQAGELREHFKKSGVPTEVTTDGDPVYRDANHRKKALACRGLHDRKSFN